MPCAIWIHGGAEEAADLHVEEKNRMAKVKYRHDLRDKI